MILGTSWRRPLFACPTSSHVAPRLLLPRAALHGGDELSERVGVLAPVTKKSRRYGTEPQALVEERPRYSGARITSTPTMTASLRLLSYNLLEGLRPIAPASGERRHIDRERAEAARTVVRDLHPDILVLNEALFCRQYLGRTADYARLFGFPYETSALYSDAWGNAILSRYPIARSHEIHFPDRGGLVAVIETPQGELTVASYHPHPNRHFAAKAADFVRLVSGLTGPLIVGGDFNCISPEDSIDRPTLIQAFGTFAQDPETVLDQFVESGCHVFGLLREQGLKDAIPPDGRRYSIPTDLISLNKNSGIRIDHILTNEAIEVVGGEVVHSAASNQASDHHPVMLEFRIGH
jgi:endonuclease/exonuclease/phosphatase family metal-dependent hydrolase